MKKTKLIMLGFALLLISAIFFNSIYAYFTDGDTATNTFTIGKIKIGLQEPNWTPPENILPNEEVNKDPKVVNTGKNEAYIYLTVQIPIKNIVTSELDGTRKNKDYVELFTYDINPGWEQVGTDIVQETDVIKIYAYSTNANCTPLKPEETTPSLFDSVTFCNAIEDQDLEGTSQEVIINAYGIQTNNVNGDKTDTISIWEVIKNQRQLKYDETQPPVGKQAILMSGLDFNALFLEHLPTATVVEFTKDRAIPMDITPIDFSEKQDKSILGWQEENTVYINAETDILANPDCSGMFSGCDKLEEISFKNIDTSNVTNMAGMFNSCQDLTQLDVSNFNTSNVTDMSYMFEDCQSLTRLDLSSFDTSNVTMMSCMFDWCSSLTSLNLNNFDTSNVIDMSSMFASCHSLTQLDISNFDTSNVANMDNMFAVCKVLPELDISNFDTSNVANMDNMFDSCASLTQLNLSNFNTSKATTMESMFSGCTSLQQLNVSNFDTSNVTNMNSIFDFCSNLTTIYVRSQAELDAFKGKLSSTTNFIIK